MDPAGPDEIDEIIAGLMADDGPPLMIRFADNHVAQAGTRRLTWGSLKRAREQAREARRKLVQLETIMRDRGWEQDESTMTWRPRPR